MQPKSTCAFRKLMGDDDALLTGVSWGSYTVESTFFVSVTKCAKSDWIFLFWVLINLLLKKPNH